MYKICLFKVVFYIKDSFAKDYEGGDIYALDGQDTYFLSFFETCDLIKGMNYTFIVDKWKIWWKHVGCLKKDLKPYRWKHEG